MAVHHQDCLMGMRHGHCCYCSCFSLLGNNSLFCSIEPGRTHASAHVALTIES